MTSCSIVIRAYNEEKHIGRLLSGIAQQAFTDYEIILVDSGSTDDTISIASGYPVKILNIPPAEFSFGRSLNLGIREALGEFIVMASAHVYPVYPDWIQRLLEPFDNPDVSLTYGKQRGAITTRFSEQQVFTHWFPDTAEVRQGHPFCNNANAAIRRRLWDERPYDESLPGLEDLDWARWALGQGHQIAYVPEAEIVHVHNETPRGVYNRYRREAMAFRKIFPEERFLFWDFARLFTSNAASDTWHALRQRVLWKNLGSIIWFRLAQFWGTYQGYRHSGPLTWQLRQTFYYPRRLSSTSEAAKRPVDPIQYTDAS
jgi:rhamnosyltransferase